MSRKTRQTRMSTEAQHTEKVVERVVDEDTSIAVPLREEYLQVEKMVVKAGEVIIRKEVQSESQTLPVELFHDEVSVERVPVNRYFNEDERPERRIEGDTTIIPIIEEQAVIVKRYFVREEIRITQQRTMARKELSATVRKEQLVIETSGNIQPENSSTQAVDGN